MKIIIANKFYYPRGGDCTYVLNLERLLQKYEHEVAIFSMQYPKNLECEWNEYWPSEMRTVDALSRPFGTKSVKGNFERLIDDFKPDVVHLNNIHTQLSPVIAEIAHKKGIKVVWTLHDYKLLCPRYDCLQNGKEVCERCLDSKSSVLIHSCMKNSKMASIIAYIEAMKWNRKRLDSCTDLFICPSQFMADLMTQAGFDKHKIKTVHHFIDLDLCKTDSREKEDYYCYLGRVSHEKGLYTLINAANQLPYKLIIIGDGTLREELAKISEPHIEWVGFKQWEEIKEYLIHAKFIVSPSEWYEVFGLVNMEALCLGTPVLGANIGGIPELIEDGKNGFTFESRNVKDLTIKIQEMWNATWDYEAIAQQAQERYSSELYYEQLIKYYKGK